MPVLLVPATAATPPGVRRTPQRTEPRSHDARKQQDDFAARIVARGRDLRELRQFAIGRIPEVRAQQCRVRARSQQLHDLIFMQMGGAGNGGSVRHAR